MTHTLILRVLALLVALLCWDRPASALYCQSDSTDGSFGDISKNILDGTQATTTMSIVVNCYYGSPGQSLTLCISLGDFGGGRVLVATDSGDTIALGIFSDSSYSKNWGYWSAGGSGVADNITLDGSGIGSKTYTAYAKVFSAQPTSQARPAKYQNVSYLDLWWYNGSNQSCQNGSNMQPANRYPTFNATVSNYCDNLVVPSLDFMSTSDLSSNVTSPALVIYVNCTNSTPFYINFGPGQHYNGTQRRMAHNSGVSFIAYDLCLDQNCNAKWTPDVNSSCAPSAMGSLACANQVQNGAGGGTGSRNAAATRFYGRVPAQTPNPPLVVGTYTDTVTVTVNY